MIRRHSRGEIGTLCAWETGDTDATPRDNGLESMTSLVEGIEKN